MPCVGRSALAAVAAVVLLAGTWVCAAQAGATFGAETFTLDNGMQVVVIPNHRAPVVYHSVWYKVGAADEPAGKSGIAHMLEHLMGRGFDLVVVEVLEVFGKPDVAFSEFHEVDCFEFL